MAASGSTPAAAACSAWARPISAPLARDRRVVGHVLGLERRHPDAGAGQPPADAGRHDALAGVRRRPAHEQRAPHRADTLPAPIGLPPARVEPAHLDPAAARRHRAPPPRAARVEEQPAARGPRAAAHAGQARRVRQQRHGVDRDGEADGARLRRRPRQAPGAVVGRGEPRGGRRLGVVAGKRLEVGTSRPATLRERREDAVKDEPQRAGGLELGVVDDRAPVRSPPQGGGPSEPGRGGRAARRCPASAAGRRTTSRRCWRSPGTAHRPRA